MHLLASREYPVIDYQTMAEFIGHERLFRAANGDAFLLHMSSDWKLAAEERIIWLTARDAHHGSTKRLKNTVLFGNSRGRWPSSASLKSAGMTL